MPVARKLRNWMKRRRPVFSNRNSREALERFSKQKGNAKQFDAIRRDLKQRGNRKGERVFRQGAADAARQAKSELDLAKRKTPWAKIIAKRLKSGWRKLSRKF